MMTLSELDNGFGFESQEDMRLYETMVKGSREEIRDFCQSRDIQSKFIKDDMNPMHVVAIAGRDDAEVILQMMLENGFDINARTKHSEDTVLHLIVEHVEIRDSFPLVLKMMEYNPDLTIRNRKLRTPYDIAMARGEFELAEVLAGTMSLPQARDFYNKKIGALYGLIGNEVKPLSARTQMFSQAKLLDAVIKSKEADIDLYLKLGADPNFVNEHHNAPIHYAITHCKLRPTVTLKMLIEKGADVNLQDDEGDTALNLVIKSERLRETGEMYKCAELLVNQGALSTYRDLDGNDALQLATKREYADIVRLLTGTRPQHIREPPPPPPPQPRVPSPEPESEEEMEPESPPPPPIQQSIPPLPFPLTNEEDEGDTPHPPPLPRVSEEEQQEEEPVPQFIMNDFLTFRDHDGDDDYQFTYRFLEPKDDFVDVNDDDDDDDGRTPDELLLQVEEVVDEQEDAEDLENYLIRAVQSGTVEEVDDALTRIGVDPNQPDSKGLYPLHYTCTRDEFLNGEDDRIAMIKLLLDNGADLNAQTDVSNSTTLHIAATNNQDHVAKLLLDTHRCKYHMKNKDGKTAYEVAQSEGNREVMDVIEKHRIRVGDRFRRTAKASTCTIL